MIETWLPVLIALGGSFLSGYLGVRVGMARMEERQIALSARVERAEDEIQRLRDWRHLKADPYINDMEHMNERVNRLETWRNGKP